MKPLKPLTVAAIAVGGLLALSLLATRKAIGTLNFYVSAIKARFAGLTPILEIKIGIQNPSADQFDVNAFVGNVYANGELIGNVSQFEGKRIPPASQVDYTIEVRLQAIGIATDIFALLQQGSGNGITILFSGTVNANGAVIPLELTYKLL